MAALETEGSEVDAGSGQQAAILLRHGETFIKGRNRSLFEETLKKNILHAVDHHGEESKAASRPRILAGQGRFFLFCDRPQVERLLSRLRWIFGLSSYSPAFFAGETVDQIAEMALQVVDRERRRSSLETFKISSKRSDKRFPLSSVELNAAIGAAVAKASDLKVDLDDPDLEIGIEIGRDFNFIFTDRRRGPGGLPVGVSGKLTLLLSGGIDSPVAGHLVQKRGCALHAVHFEAPPYTSARSLRKAVDLARILARRQDSLRMHIVSFSRIQERIRDLGPTKLRVILYRRAMVKIASALGIEENSKGLATGESMGQVASQTIPNLSCIEEASPLIILRPLLAYDKLEIIQLAKVIGTYEISISSHEDSCSLFVPKHPSTKSKPALALAAEGRMDLEPLLQRAIWGAKMIEL